MERALIDGELSATRSGLHQEEEELSGLLKRSICMEEKHGEERTKAAEAIEVSGWGCCSFVFWGWQKGVNLFWGVRGGEEGFSS